MGKCKYCQEKAGLLKSRHKECENKYLKGRRTLTEAVSYALTGNISFGIIRDTMANVTKNNFVQESEHKDLLIAGYDQAVEKYLDDGILSEKEEERATNFRQEFELTQDELNKNGSLNRLVKAAILREVTEGKIPERIKVEDGLPFNLQKSEKIIWLDNDIEYHEQKIKTEYRGGYQGVSVKVAKGVYYRTGGFRGRPVHTKEMVHLGTGTMAFTNKHIYFASVDKNFRLRYDRIVTLQPYDNAISVTKEGVTAKPQVFINVDPWFTYNLIMNLNQQ